MQKWAIRIWSQRILETPSLWYMQRSNHSHKWNYCAHKLPQALEKNHFCLSFVCYMLKNCHVSFECKPVCLCFCCLYCALFVHNSVNIIIHLMESNKVRKTCIATTNDGYLHSHSHTQKSFHFMQKSSFFCGNECAIWNCFFFFA